jgi:hypothetical protein
MLEIIYTDHLKLRLELRKIPFDYPKLIFQQPEQLFFDTLEKRNISIKTLKYNNKLRNIMIAYEHINETIEIVTIHPISDEKIINRITSMRWIENEQKI